MTAQRRWHEGQVPTGDLVGQMHNARGAFFKHLTICPCTGRLEIEQFVGDFGVPTKWWVHCHGCGARSPMKKSIGEATYAWDSGERSNSNTTGESHALVSR